MSNHPTYLEVLGMFFMYTVGINVGGWLAHSGYIKTVLEYYGL
jgi:hypothetical protein